MSTQPVIMVQVADGAWTLEAVKRASEVARRQSAEIVLINLVQVQHLGWLGTDFGYISLSHEVQAAISAYERMLEDEGVRFRSEIFQYVTLTDAIVQAAEQVNANIVFATVPKSIIPFWQRFQLEKVRYQLAEAGRALVEYPDEAHIPAELYLAGATEN